MGENDLQVKIVLVLATIIGTDKLEELELALQMMDEEGRNQLILFVSTAVQLNQLDKNTLAKAQELAKQALQKGKARKAEFGAKLAYINKLSNYKKGGKLVKKAKDGTWFDKLNLRPTLNYTRIIPNNITDINDSYQTIYDSDSLIVPGYMDLDIVDGDSTFRTHTRYGDSFEIPKYIVGEDGKKYINPKFIPTSKKWEFFKKLVPNKNINIIYPL